MAEFFKVTELQAVLAYTSDFDRVGTEDVALSAAGGRILAADVVSAVDLPDFRRSTMDGYAVAAASTFGASEANPAYLSVRGIVAMGEKPTFVIGPGEAARISTGGMLPDGADSVAMIEHTAPIDDTTIELYHAIAPGQHVIEAGEDIARNEPVLFGGTRIRPAETGLLAAFGHTTLPVYRQPVIGIISTGDEVVPIDRAPAPGQIRDINTYTLSGMVSEAGAVPRVFGIVHDDFQTLFDTCTRAVKQTDMVLISGGSSVGVRDFTVDVLSALPAPKILVHGISISPGKPTILAKSGGKAIWGLPGHVVSAMIVFAKVVRPFIDHIAGRAASSGPPVGPRALLSRNVSSAQGRVDFVRVQLTEENGILWAHPILGKSGLIRTMVKADGLIEIGMNTEGLDRETEVTVQLL